ncbi:Membrane protein involved in the export of O-antigen and teichoic acid [Acetoanaerobium noterae]|uniref:Membrane protein involved in the export of O-antigen and teichoic acid n=1 Tax=Acetoanaerobium noterae TaxID=745369 RepID=A0A1T5AZK5_9FIRM|nr:lipopolysaccharide biosynthesis protein [Acetoanaerobium noterae]SKB40405.1 Membrane protein involved in the export of O-antigen and teichoic acid [Acetoanaerobium noterae]
MQTESIKSNIVSSLMWKLLERSGTQGIQFIVQIILARLLSPEEFGVIAIVMVFILLANVFVQSGFNTALIQKKNADEVDFSSVLYLSLGVATILYTVIFFCAPFVAKFYNQPVLTNVLRILSITLFIGAVNSIQNAFVAKHMLFKKLFVCSLGAVIISGVIGIVAAYRGMGVWALVAQQLTNQLTVAVLLWSTVKWRPQLVFSIQRVKSLFSYGSKLLASGLIDTLYRELTTLIIGRVYSPSMIGFYNRGQQFPQLIVANINGSIQSVMLPALSACQDDKKRVKEMMRRAIVSSSFLIFPMMIGMAVVSKQLVLIVLTEKWLPAVPFLQISCLTFSLWPIHTANLQAINAMGRSDIFLRLEIIKKTVGLIILGITLPFGVYALALGVAISGIIFTFINAYPNKQLLNYSYKEQLIDIMPSLFISITMGGIVYSLNLFSFNDWQILILQIILGVSIYIGLARTFNLESFNYLVRTIRQLKRKNEYS